MKQFQAFVCSDLIDLTVFNDPSFTILCSDLIDLTVFNDPSFTILRPIALQMFSAPCSFAASERVFRLDNATIKIKIVESYASQTCVSKMQQTTAVIN